MDNQGIGFWKKESGNLMSIGKGLSQAEVELLQSLKPGDRLILWSNRSSGEKTPQYTLKKYSKPTDDEI